MASGLERDMWFWIRSHHVYNESITIRNNKLCGSRVCANSSSENNNRRPRIVPNDDDAVGDDIDADDG